MIFHWVGVEHSTAYAVVKRLYEQGIKPRKMKRDIWTKGPITRMLTNETYYKGEIYFNKTESVMPKKPLKDLEYRKIKKTSRKLRPKDQWISFKAPVMIEKWLFDKVQDTLLMSKKFAPRNNHYEYLLSGKIYCGCGQRRVGDGASPAGDRYYRCIDRLHRYPVKTQCKIPGVNAVVMDTVFWNSLKKELSNPEILRKQAEQYYAKKLESIPLDGVKQKQLHDELHRIKQEEARYIKAYGSGSLDFDQFNEVMKDLKLKRKVIDASLSKIEEKQPSVVMGVSKDVLVERLISEAKRVIEGMMVGDKKPIIQDIIEKVIIHDAGEVEVNCLLPVMKEKLEHELKYRDRQVAGTTNNNLSFPFQFRFTLPKSRKDREIILRNSLGQIVVSKVPDISYAEGGR